MALRAREAQSEGRPARQDYRWVGYARISSALKRAVLVAEDSLFWEHEGVDLEQMRASIELNLRRGGVVRGGSTITQQLAKNLYLSPSKDPFRKLRELMITRQLERHLSKRRILELYLNVIEWGDGIWGAEAASRRYFRKPASTLGASEAALLAGAIINPVRYSPASPPARLRRRQRIILQRMGMRNAPVPPAESEPPARLPAVEQGTSAIGTEIDTSPSENVEPEESTVPPPVPETAPIPESEEPARPHAPPAGPPRVP